MSTHYQPPPEQIRRLKDELTDAYKCTITDEHAVMVLQRQHSREKGLLEALESIAPSGAYGNRVIANRALAAHAALDAAPEPTLLEAAKALLASYEPSVDYKAFCAARESVRAAVERAERAK